LAPTAFLTQTRADQVMELHGSANPHVHLDSIADGNAATKNH
jgi:hypothetical protein